MDPKISVSIHLIPDYTPMPLKLPRGQCHPQCVARRCGSESGQNSSFQFVDGRWGWGLISLCTTQRPATFYLSTSCACICVCIWHGFLCINKYVHASIYMCAYVYTCIYICVYMLMCIGIYALYTCMCAYMCIPVCIHVCLCVHVCIYMHVSTFMHAYMYARIQVYVFIMWCLSTRTDRMRRRYLSTAHPYVV